MDNYDYGVCPDCRKPNTGYAWCNKCDPGKFLKEGKTSGNPEIDNLIYQSQLKVDNYYDAHLEWIPYDRLQNIKPIGEGGFAKIFSATWLDGKLILDRTKKRTVPIRVALKKLKNSKNMEAFINEVNYFKIIKSFNLWFVITFFIIIRSKYTMTAIIVIFLQDFMV